MKKTSLSLPETVQSQATNLETQKQTKWIKMQQSQGNVCFQRGPLRIKMINGTEKPQFPLKFAKYTVRHNEFGYNFLKKDRRTLCYGTD